MKSVVFKMFLKSVFISLIILVSVNKSHNLCIECDYDISYAAHYGNLYTCIIYKIWDIEEPRITFINGTHDFNNSARDVKGIWFKENTEKLKYFPQNILTFFPNFVHISIWFNNFSTISSRDLQSFPDLEWIRIKNSKIESIPGDLFKFNPKIKFVGLNDNKLLDDIGKNLLNNLKKLERAEFTGNKCVDIDADSLTMIKHLKTFCKTRPQVNSYEIDEKNISNHLEEIIKDQRKIITDLSTLVQNMEKLIMMIHAKKDEKLNLKYYDESDVYYD